MASLFGADKPLSANQAKLATNAHQVLVNYCGKCHGKGGSYSDEMLLDYSELVGGDEPFVVKGKVDESYLYETIANGDMPPKKAKNPIPANELAVIKKWIGEGAPNWELAPQVKREFVSNDSVIQSIVSDLQKLGRRDRQFVRYYTLTHLYNAGESEDALENYRIALSKLVNSLSWERNITSPVSIDAQKTVLRLDLRDYGWDTQIWRKITANYPYAVNYSSKSYELLRKLSKAEILSLRADWFISFASVPPLYHEILELPKTDKELEDKLNVDVRRNLRDSVGRKVWRSGFLKSGVSKFNRIVERHESNYGAYWKSYDFDSNKGRKNIFQNPLAFQHAGGEIIFNLPNGLQGYLLADEKGNRIDEAPVNIVFTTQGRDPVIRNGLSCMACHTAGMKDFKDRAGELHLAIQNTRFDDADEKEFALALYPDAKTINVLVEEDKETFERAVNKLGGVVGGKEPIALLTERYEEPFGLKMAAAEAGMDEVTFLAKMKRHELIKTTGLNTLVAKGTISREVWEQFYPLVITALGVGDPRFNPNQYKRFNETLSAEERLKWMEQRLEGNGGKALEVTIPAEELKKLLNLQKQLDETRKRQEQITRKVESLKKQIDDADSQAERDRLRRELAEASVAQKESERTRAEASQSMATARAQSANAAESNPGKVFPMVPKPVQVLLPLSYKDKKALRKIQVANWLFNRRLYELAIEKYRMFHSEYKDDPNRPNVVLALGVAYLKVKQREEAEELFIKNSQKKSDLYQAVKDLEGKTLWEGDWSAQQSANPLILRAARPAEVRGKPSTPPNVKSSDNPEIENLGKLIIKLHGKPSMEIIERLGGSASTELAISWGLDWFTKNQERDGHWEMARHGGQSTYNTAGAGLALLCYYGWGIKHKDGTRHARALNKALQWLLKQQKEDGDLRGNLGGRMYCHGIAAIALCEAYGLTKDPKLKDPAERAIDFILKAQHTEGGWRYIPGQKGDLSVSGWQYRAMHSARMAGLKVPDLAFVKARRFFAAVAGGRNGGRYGFSSRAPGSKTMTALGMFMRQLDLTPPTGANQMESAEFIKSNILKANIVDFLFDYYATLALYQHQGPVWKEWNKNLKEIYVARQVHNGLHKGSWEPLGPYVAGGGRVLSTALAVLSLEVYYQRLPIYGFGYEE